MNTRLLDTPVVEGDSALPSVVLNHRCLLAPQLGHEAFLVKDVQMAKSRPAITTPSASRPLLFCPIRGPLTVSALAKDGLTPTEELRRIELINFLLDKDYPPENIAVETVILKKLGESGRNKLRCDLIAYSETAAELEHLDIEERVKRAVLVAEVKRENAKKLSGITCQLEPAMRQLPGMAVMGVYWDDLEHILFVKQLVRRNGDQQLEIIADELSNLPSFRGLYKAKLLTYPNLLKGVNLLAILHKLANVMRSHSINEPQLRYKETVKLLLAKYCDEKEGMERHDETLALQLMPGADLTFMQRVTEVYNKAATRYSRAETLFKPIAVSELPEAALRDVVRVVQSTEFSSASNETLQQVFMTFVPAVFKKNLDQYFTPISLIQAIVQMVKIGPNDKVADPGMGTADFLTAAMEYRAKLGDKDIHQRVIGIDSDPFAFDLAVINMILNKDGQAGLRREDSIENHVIFSKEMGVVLCNPPFGEQSIENKKDVLKAYDLGHRWEYDALAMRWRKTDELLPHQQLGILFIERCYKMLDDRGRLGIIMPEGYLSTAMYGYVRQWIFEHLRILSLVELPRRIFVKSGVDLRSNILIAQRLPAERIARLIASDYPIHTEMVRKVGFKMGKGSVKLFSRDPETGQPLRDEGNELIPESDFRRVCDGFNEFTQKSKWDRSSVHVVDTSWHGARISDIRNHANLDMKPRRLMPLALANIKTIKGKTHKRLDEIADVLQEKINILEIGESGQRWRLVEGQAIRAVEGIVVPSHPAHAWQIAERKAKLLYKVRRGDIIVGLVRPERRNIGLLLESGEDLVGAPDGIVVVRVKEEFADQYPQEWLFTALRSEACRLQLWTESGGTSYGKLTNDNVNELLLPVPSRERRKGIAAKVKEWFQTVQSAADRWNSIGSPADRFPVVNSPSFGLVETSTTTDVDDEDNGEE